MTPDPIYRHIGVLIKARRKTLGHKQETLARKFGISRGALANIETGRQNLLVHQLYKFAAALELSPFDLLPPPSAESVKVNPIDLPLPSDLKAEQRTQVAQFFSQIDTTAPRTKEEISAKKTKR